MTKRRRFKAESPREMRQRRLFWRTAAVMALVLASCVITYFIAGHHSHPPGEDDHHHAAASHGGKIVTLGENDDYHVEVVMEKGGVLKLYTLGGDAVLIVEVDSQIVLAHVKPEGGSATTAIELMPMPQPSDSQGKTSQFEATLPGDFREKKLGVTIPEIVISGRTFAFEFKTIGAARNGNTVDNGQGEEVLFLTPSGKYTDADIRANGNQSPSRKFQGFQASHDAKPISGDKICPVSRTKANSKCSWIVGGHAYEFCCPPCIAKFVQHAREQPQTIKDPEKYMKK